MNCQPATGGTLTLRRHASCGSPNACFGSSRDGLSVLFLSRALLLAVSACHAAAWHGGWDRPEVSFTKPHRPPALRTRRVASPAAYDVKDASELAESFDLLGIAPGASLEELRRAYRAKARECHPDTSASEGVDPEEAARRFAEVQVAYRQLSNMINEKDGLPLSLDAWGGQFTWQLTPVEAAGFGAKAQEQTLRDMVWFSLAWGARLWNWQLEGAQRDKRGLPPRVAGEEVLMQVFIPLLDEMARRDLLIYYAKMAGDDAKVSKLRTGRSTRHQVHEEWLAALATDGEGSERAAALRADFEDLSEQVGDITVDKVPYPEEWGMELARILATPRKALA